MEASQSPLKMKLFNMHRVLSRQAFNALLKLWLEGALCDVILVADGVKFEAHKIILCSYSSYFKALFSSGWSVKGKHEYIIPGVSSEAMGLIIKYAYTHSVLITVDNVGSLLEAADQLNILSILEYCGCFLEDQLCIENCTDIYITADIYSCPKLHQSALRLILKNFKEVASTSEEFLELTLPQLCDIIEKDELNVREENVVFDAILHWIMHEPASRKAYISVLLPKVRLARMNEEYFMRIVKNNDLVKASEECRLIISDAIKSMYDLGINGSPYSDFHNPLIRPRLPSEILLAIGGSSYRSGDRITAYDSRADRWVHVTQQHDRYRIHHAVVYLRGFVYCIGGCDGVTFSKVCYRFDPIAQTWRRVAPLHSYRCYVSVTVLDGFVYAIGGYDGCKSLSTAERYSPDTDMWSLMRDMNTRRAAANATTMHGKVYICGGFNGIETLSTAECYNPLTDQWTMIPPMRTPRLGVGVIAYNGKIYVVGGKNESSVLQSVEAYDPLTNRWDVVAPMFNQRTFFGIEVVDDLIFVVGGHDAFATTTTVECYDAETDSWYRAQDMGSPRCFLSCCVVPALPCIIQYASPRESLTATQEERNSSANDIPKVHTLPPTPEWDRLTHNGQIQNMEPLCHSYCGHIIGLYEFL